MPTYFRFGIGPFRFSQRLGRTQAQKRAAAKARSDQAARRAYRADRERDRERSEQAEREYNSPEAVAARADLADRTYRGEIAEFHVTLLAGGSFVIRVPGEEGVIHVAVPAESAARIMSLKNRDIVQFTMSGDGSRVEAFWHMSRANGAEPRSPADFPDGF